MQTYRLMVIIVVVLCGHLPNIAASSSGNKPDPLKINVSIDIYAVDDKLTMEEYLKFVENNEPESTPKLVVEAGKPSSVEIGKEDEEGNPINRTRIKFLPNLAGTEFDLDFELMKDNHSKIGFAKNMEVGSVFLMSVNLNDETKLIKVTTELQLELDVKYSSLEHNLANVITLRSRGKTYPYLIIDKLPECKTDICEHQFNSYFQLYSVRAKLRLAEFYMAGYGIEKNEMRAFNHFKDVAKLRVPYAEYMVAKLSFKLNRATANGVNYLQRSAEKEHPDAMFLLGLIYGEGKYIDQDSALADKWLTKAYMGNPRKLSGKVSQIVMNSSEHQLPELSKAYNESNNKQLQNKDLLEEKQLIEANLQVSVDSDNDKQAVRLTFAEFFDIELESLENPKIHNRYNNYYIGEDEG